MHEVPLGVRLLQLLGNRFCGNIHFSRNVWYKVSVFTLTFLSYTCYHASRKPLSVVKGKLYRNCSDLTPPADLYINDSNINTWCDWEPFNVTYAPTLFGTLDSAFLSAYAIAMFISGFVAERMSLRYFLSIGMICSGISCYLFGIAYQYHIHSMSYFIAVQIFGGIVQTTGWPGVVAVMGNWFGEGKKGILFGLWNSHTSLGNILGTLIATWFLNFGWGLSFIVPGIVIAGFGFVNFLFLVESPAVVGCDTPSVQPCNSIKRMEDPSLPDESPDDSAYSDTELLLPQHNQISPSHHSEEEEAVGFVGALKIPGVVEFSLCLFFAKLVSYTCLYWLPLYIENSTSLSLKDSSNLSTIFDVGGMLGGILAGAFVDYTGKSAITCAVMLFLSVPLLFIYNIYGPANVWMNTILLILTGFFVNGPYALITTAVSAELGTHSSLSSNSKALATVTAIIDGTGSIGAAVGPFLAGVVCVYGWKNVFYILMMSDIFALLMLVRLVKNELYRSQQR